MSIHDDVLAELKAVFQEELAQQRDALERHRLTLLRGTSSEQEHAAAIREVYRIAHGLKGAARAVGATAVVTVAHAVEEQLAGARRNDAVPLEVARAAIEQLLEGLGIPPRSGGPESASASASEPAARPEEREEPESAPMPAAPVRVQPEGIRRVWTAVEELREVVAEELDDDETLETLAGLTVGFGELRRHLLRPDPTTTDVADATDTLRSLEQGVAEVRRRVRRTNDQATLRTARTRGRLQGLFVAVRALRAEPVRTLFERLERNCLAVAEQQRKQVRFVAEGANLMLDRDVLEAATEALMHLVSNAVSHGIESPQERGRQGKTPWGEVRCRVELRGAQARFEVTDDGRGLDVDALQRAASSGGRRVSEHGRELVFLPGVSTAQTTSTVSGRGMGLEFVRRCADELGGDVHVEPREGGGTRFVLRVPAEHGGFPALLADEDGSRYVIPLAAVARVVRRTSWAESEVPTASLRAVLRGGGSAVRGDVGVMLEGRGRTGVIWVERVVARDHVVARPLGVRARGLPMVAAAVRSTDGTVLPVLDALAVLEHLHTEVDAGPAANTPEVRQRVLVADDSITTRQLVRMILNKAGFEVIVAEDGEVAWSRFREGSFDLVVSDLEMPRMTGLDLLKQVRERRGPRTPFVMVTARDDEDARRRASNLGVDAYVLKGDFDRVSLLETIEEVLAR